MTKQLSPRHALYLYLAVLPAPTFVHDWRWLGAGLLLAIIFSGSERWRILRRSLVAIVAFNLGVSLGVAIVGFLQGGIDTTWLLTTNLRVLLMVFLGFWFVSRVDLLAALAGWPTASLIATLALGQIRVFERVLMEFRLAFASRSPVSPGLIARRRQAAAQTVALLDKAQAQSTEVALAMRSRGAFDA